MSITDFTKTDYFIAAMERRKDLEHLAKSDDSIVFALYCAGVAIECMLRAYIIDYKPEISGRHNLILLLKESTIGQYLDDKEKEQLGVDIKEAHSIWHNNLRYCSLKRLKRILGHEIVKPKNKTKDIKNYLKKFNGEIFSITSRFLNLAESKWT